MFRHSRFNLGTTGADLTKPSATIPPCSEEENKSPSIQKNVKEVFTIPKKNEKKKSKYQR